MKHILYTRTDGGITITYNVLESEVEKEAEKVIDAWHNMPESPNIANWNSLYGEIKTYRTIDAGLLPDRLFRNAWFDNKDKEAVDVNMDKARSIHMNRIREMRDQKLTELDKELSKATEQNSVFDIQRIKVEKQRLRDIPQEFDLSLADSTDKLKSLWPDNLDKHPIYNKP